MSMLNINSANGSGGMAFPALRGASAYEVAVRKGFEGTEEEWLESLHGKDGANGTNGKTAYQYAKEGGYTGTEQEFKAKMAEETPVIEPLKLNANSAETYLNDSSYGDSALEAIKNGRPILVRVPNASGDNYVANYSPVYMYQVPNHANKYLYLFFLRDEKQDLSALLGQPTGTVQMPTYGQLKMLLSKEYNSNPLEQ